MKLSVLTVDNPRSFFQDDRPDNGRRVSDCVIFISLVFGMQREQKNLDLTTSPSLYHRSSRDEGEVYTSVPVVVLTVHEAQEETHVKRSHFSYEAEDALPVGEVYLNKLSFFSHLV